MITDEQHFIQQLVCLPLGNASSYLLRVFSSLYIAGDRTHQASTLPLGCTPGPLALFSWVAYFLSIELVEFLIYL